MPIVTYQENETARWQYNADAQGRATQIIGANFSPNEHVPAMYSKGWVDLYNTQGNAKTGRFEMILAPGESRTTNLPAQYRLNPDTDPVSIGFEEWHA